MKPHELNTCILDLEYAIKRLSEPVQYSPELTDFRELQCRVKILREDAQRAKGYAEHALELLKKHEEKMRAEILAEKEGE
jgi:ATP/maltotriose-dependent transcriptional regulator MalT